MIKFMSSFIHPVPAEYEEWLEDLAQKGYHPKKFTQWSTTYLKFYKGEPKKYRYVLDIQPFVKKDYFETYKDFGWELCGQLASTYLWRMEYADERPESFSDEAARKDRNSRFVKAVSFSFILFVVTFLITLVCLILTFKKCTTSDLVQYILALILSGGLLSYIGFAMRKIKKSKK